MRPYSLFACVSISKWKLGTFCALIAQCLHALTCYKYYQGWSAGMLVLSHETATESRAMLLVPTWYTRSLKACRVPTMKWWDKGSVYAVWTGSVWLMPVCVDANFKHALCLGSNWWWWWLFILTGWIKHATNFKCSSLQYTLQNFLVWILSCSQLCICTCKKV